MEPISPIFPSFHFSIFPYTKSKVYICRLFNTVIINKYFPFLSAYIQKKLSIFV